MEKIPLPEQLGWWDRVIQFGQGVLGHLARNNEFWTGHPNVYERRGQELGRIEKFANDPSQDSGPSTQG